MIKGFIGPTSNTLKEDVLLTKSALQRLGFYNSNEEITPYPDQKLFSAIKSFQKELGMPQNGEIKSGDKTANKLQELLNKSSEPGVRSPQIHCPNCGVLHGGVRGALCNDCWTKLL